MPCCCHASAGDVGEKLTKWQGLSPRTRNPRTMRRHRVPATMLENSYITRRRRDAEREKIVGSGWKEAAL